MGVDLMTPACQRYKASFLGLQFSSTYIEHSMTVYNISKPAIKAQINILPIVKAILGIALVISARLMLQQTVVSHKYVSRTE